MCPIISTVLFKSIKRSHPNWDSSDLCYQLAEAARTANVDWSSTSVALAFTWMLTPQKTEYWMKVHNVM